MSVGAAILYSRRACPLCFALGRLADRSSRRHGVRLVEVDVDADPDLRRRYGDRVPCLQLPGGGSIAAGATARDVDDAFARSAEFLLRLEGSDRTWVGRLFGRRKSRTS